MTLAILIFAHALSVFSFFQVSGDNTGGVFHRFLLVYF